MSDYADDIPPGTEVTVLTVGHAHHSVEHYLRLLRLHGVDVVVDIRSRPYARHAEHFNREQLAPTLEAADVGYLWLGERLGQRPDGDEYYDEAGHVLYDRIASRKWFLKDIGRVEYEAERRRVALTCLEEEPERCHRYWLLGRVLAERGARVVHVRRDGSVEGQADVDHRLGITQGSLFDEPRPWRSPQPMRDAHGGTSA